MTTYGKKRRTLLSSFAVFQDSSDEVIGTSRLAQAKAIAHRSRVHSPASDESPDELSTFNPSEPKLARSTVAGKSSSSASQQLLKASPPQVASRKTDKPLPPPPTQENFEKPIDQHLAHPLSHKSNNHKMPRPWERGRSSTKLQISAPFNPQKRDASLPRLLSDDLISSKALSLPRSTSAGNFGSTYKPTQYLRDPKHVPSSKLEPHTRALHAAHRNQSSAGNMAKQTKNTGIFQKVKGVITGHLTSGPSTIRDDSASITNLPEEYESILPGRRTPDNMDSISLEDVLKQRRDEQAALERSPKLQRVLGAFEVAGPTARGLQGFKNGSPPYQRLPTIIDNSPKLQQFFGTSPTASTHPLRQGECHRTNGSPTRRRMTMYALDRNGDLRTDDDELGVKPGDDMIGLGITESRYHVHVPRSDPKSHRLSTLSKDVPPQPDFSGFNFFPEDSNFPNLSSQFSKYKSGLRQHPNVMEFAEAPARIKTIDESAKRDGMTLSRSPFKRINSHQYAYKPELYKPWGASPSTVDEEDAATFTDVMSSTKNMPTIKIKRTSDVSKRTSDGSKRSSTDAGLIFESPPSSKKNKNLVQIEALSSSGRPMSNGRVTSFTSDFKFDEDLINFSPVSRDNESVAPTQTPLNTKNFNPPAVEGNDSFTWLLDSERVSGKVRGPNRLKRMSMPLQSLSKNHVDFDNKILTFDQTAHTSGAKVIGGNSVAALGVSTASNQGSELLPSPAIGGRDNVKLAIGPKRIDSDDEDELQLDHKTEGSRQWF